MKCSDLERRSKVPGTGRGLRRGAMPLPRPPRCAARRGRVGAVEEAGEAERSRGATTGGATTPMAGGRRGFSGGDSSRSSSETSCESWNLENREDRTSSESASTTGETGAPTAGVVRLRSVAPSRSRRSKAPLDLGVAFEYFLTRSAMNCSKSFVSTNCERKGVRDGWAVRTKAIFLKPAMPEPRPPASK